MFGDRLEAIHIHSALAAMPAMNVQGGEPFGTTGEAFSHSESLKPGEDHPNEALLEHFHELSVTTPLSKEAMSPPSPIWFSQASPSIDTSEKHGTVNIETYLNI